MQEEEDRDEESADTQSVDQRQEREGKGERQPAEEFHGFTLADVQP